MTGRREAFSLPRDARGEPLVYFCGHSLGLMPLAARERLGEEIEQWANLGIEGQFTGRRPWVDYAALLAPGLARLAGAGTDEVVAMNALSVNLHLLLASFYRPTGRRTRILIEAGAFSSDRHAVASQIAWHGHDPRTCLHELAPRGGESTLRQEDILEAIAGMQSELALVLWPVVQFRTGQAFDCASIASAAHAAGAIVGFDAAHAIGNLPLELHDWDADFAVWCGYKYLNGGPGAVGGAFVHERHADRRAFDGLAGWWGHEPRTRFEMAPAFEPSRGAAGWQVSNPPIFSSAPLLASLALFDEAGIPALRAQSIALTGALAEAIGTLSPLGLDLVTPRSAAERGCQLSVRVVGGPSRGKAVFDALRAQGVVGDWRAPDIIRLAPVPLYNTMAEVALVASHLEAALRTIR